MSWGGQQKRDFMEVNPPRTEEDFYKGYDPLVGISTAVILCVFFLLVTIKSLIRYSVRKWQMYHFYKNMEKEADAPPSVQVA